MKRAFPITRGVFARVRGGFARVRDRYYLVSHLQPQSQWPNAFLVHADEAVCRAVDHRFEETRWESFEADILVRVVRGNLEQVVRPVWVNPNGVIPASRLIFDQTDQVTISTTGLTLNLSKIVDSLARM